jgi:hypothetical protein
VYGYIENHELQESTIHLQSDIKAPGSRPRKGITTVSHYVFTAAVCGTKSLTCTNSGRTSGGLRTPEPMQVRAIPLSLLKALFFLRNARTCSR